MKLNLLTFCLLLLVGWAHAQNTYLVTSTADIGPNTLRQAIDLAEGDAAMDTIRFDASLSNQTIVLNSPLTINQSTFIDGRGAPNLAISGGWDGKAMSSVGSRIFIFPDNSTRVVFIRNLILKEGNAGNTDNDTAPNNTELFSNGGIIYFNGGSALFEEVDFLNSTAHDGAFLYAYAGTILTNNCSFSAGKARDDGGVAYVGAVASWVSQNSTFYANITNFGNTVTSNENHEGSVVLSEGISYFEHCTFAYNKTSHGATINLNQGFACVSNNLFVDNINESLGDIFGTGSTYDFLVESLEPSDGNFTTNQTPNFTSRSSDAVKLSPLYKDANGVYSCALDCSSQLFGTVSSTGFDRKGIARGNDSEPGAVELYGCPDLDGDAIRDAIDPDDDADSILDKTELAFVKLDTVNLLDFASQGETITAVSYNTNGTTLTLTSSGTPPSGGYALASVEGDIQGNTGIKLAHKPTNVGDKQVYSISFDEPVYGLSFTIADIDKKSADGIETVEVNLFYDDALVNIDAQHVVLGSNVSRQGNRFTPIADLALDGFSNPAGNAFFGGFNNPLNRVEIVLSGGDATLSPEEQMILVSTMSFRNIGQLDIDNDGKPAIYDIDADGDGLVDFLEAQSSFDYSATATDITPIDSDGDGLVDFLDADTDDDGEFDIIEGHDTNNDGVIDALDTPIFGTGQPNFIDADNDGLDDGFDDNAAIFGTGQLISNDGLPETQPTDADFDWRDDNANIAGFVWYDQNLDGVKQDTEAVFPNVNILIREADTDQLILTRATGADGRFLAADFGGFGNPNENARIYLEFLAPDGFGNPTAIDRGNNDRLDSDIDPVTYRTAVFTVNPDKPEAFFGAGFSDLTLPTRFDEVTLSVSDSCVASLSWSKGSEDGLAFYQIERFVPSSGKWVVEQIIEPDGRSIYTQDLAFVAAEYRLSGIDESGAISSSPVIVVENCTVTSSTNDQQGTQRMKAFPNPTLQGAMLQLEAGAPYEMIVVFDAQGRVILKDLVTDGNGNASFDTQLLSSGMYIIRVGAQSLRVFVK